MADEKRELELKLQQVEQYKNRLKHINQVFTITTHANIVKLIKRHCYIFITVLVQRNER